MCGYRTIDKEVMSEISFRKVTLPVLSPGWLVGLLGVGLLAPEISQHSWLCTGSGDCQSFPHYPNTEELREPRILPGRERLLARACQAPTMGLSI